MTYRSVVSFVLVLFTQAVMAEVPVLQAEVLAIYPHDAQAFTQGLVIENGQLFEGTGRLGESSLRRVNLENGEILQRKNLGSRYFGEGITIMNDLVYQLTWQSHLGFVYDLESFAQRQTFFIATEGWGLTNDGESLILSDGSATLYFLDPETFRETRRIQVTADGMPQDRLNELEFINGEVWANVWYTDFIVRIDPQSGVINSMLDLSMLNEQQSRDDVLNGIAWDASAERLFVTGKLWSQLYEIKVRE